MIVALSSLCTEDAEGQEGGRRIVIILVVAPGARGLRSFRARGEHIDGRVHHGSNVRGGLVAPGANFLEVFDGRVDLLQHGCYRLLVSTIDY